MIKLYGITNCNTVKKACDWLSGQGKAVSFHDFKKQGLSSELASNWLSQSDWEKLVNRKGLTWRGLSDERKEQIVDNNSALALMLEKTSVIKRPILEKDDKLLFIGFNEAAYYKIFDL